MPYPVTLRICYLLAAARHLAALPSCSLLIFVSNSLTSGSCSISCRAARSSIPQRCCGHDRRLAAQPAMRLPPCAHRLAPRAALEPLPAASPQAHHYEISLDRPVGHLDGSQQAEDRHQRQPPDGIPTEFVLQAAPDSVGVVRGRVDPRQESLPRPPATRGDAPGHQQDGSLVVTIEDPATPVST